MEFAGLASGRITRGHRFLAPGPHEVANAADLIGILRAAKVVPSEEEREASIRAQVAEIEKKTGLVAELPAKTMEEVVNLTEFPTVMVGAFDELFLAVPKEITVDAMLMHQRYFPLFNADGTLSNKFLITSNGDPAFEANIVDGNQRVVAARLYDAKFFYDEDLEALVNERDREECAIYTLEGVQVSCGFPLKPTATVTLRGPEGDVRTVCDWGAGPIDAVYKAIDQIVQVDNDLSEFAVNAVTRGIDALGEVTVRVKAAGGEVYVGRGADGDIIVSSAKAYLNALNRLLAEKR